MSGGFLYSEFHCYTIAHWAPITTLDPIKNLISAKGIPSYFCQKNFSKKTHCDIIRNKKLYYRNVF